MARPDKYGLDYFPMQTDVASDPKITKMIRDGEQDAWTVWTFVLILAYKESYYTTKENVCNTVSFLFRDLSEERVEECLQILVDAGLLHRGYFEQGIITSSGIQKQYDQSTVRRKSEPPKDYRIQNYEKRGVNVDNNSLEPSYCMHKPDVSEVDADKSTQTETETEIKLKVNKTENKTENKEDRNSDSSDSFHSSFDFSSDFSDPLYVASVLEKDYGCKLPKNTLEKINKWIRDYDYRSIAEAHELAVTKGARSIVGYMDTVLRKWSLGDGSPKWIEREEQEIAREKEEYMRPGALGKILVNGHEALGT